MSHAVVVGGSRGIGRAAVRAFVKAGTQVTSIGRRAAPPEDQVSGVEHVVADVTDAASIRAALERSTERFGPIHHLVFLQRYRGQGDAWAGEIEVSLTATKSLIEQALPFFAEAGDRSIVFVSTVAGKLVGEGQPVGYHVAKAGLESMARFYAVTLGSRGIRSNAVAPCTILKDESKHVYLNDERLHALYRKMTPLGRMGTADEVAAVISFLTSPQASFVTGQTITVDGGLTLQLHDSFGRKLSPG